MGPVHEAPPRELADEEFLKGVPGDGDVEIVRRHEARGAGVGGRVACATLRRLVEFLCSGSEKDARGRGQGRLVRR